MKRWIKSQLSRGLSYPLSATRRLRESFRRVASHALLASEISDPLPGSAVVLGKVSVFGTRNVRIAENVLLYPDLHLETQGNAQIALGENVVISRGVHIVAMAGVSVGRGCMIGEYTSIRDANHGRSSNGSLRDAPHTAKPIILGKDVWIGRGVTVLGGVTIGDNATVGANAVVTKDVAPGETVVGVPAMPLQKNERSRLFS